MPDYLEALSPETVVLPSPPGITVDLTVVVAAYNEAGNIGPLIAEIAGVLRPRFAFEIICVDDGSTDATLAEAAALGEAVPELRIVRHSDRAGQSAAICTGIALARGGLVATIDGDGQNDPADIPALVDCARQAGAALVTGVRTVRHDRLSKRVASRLANAVRAGVLRDGCPDTGCGLKVFPRRAFERLPQFDGMHRYLPALFRARGAAVILRPVSHRPRVRGVSKYGNLERAALGAVDLLGVLWLTRRSRSPERVFEQR
ncbi:glycosyltransferase family 2 protein [Acidisphaera rubrifaciens]|uniref:Glycosyl transferase n=1 Tax=Acidisphaera rubrifaciens HS-AP3 TaxID=1231350 RepID=A0A0D6P4B5_9PROT|nr:glycosyltransferase family 2 protein [Acidisphaera rubrifaciens]GAN76048.1 glycosyl transferase [Acidisphaera rubrifaciens HS-AP3]